MKKISFTISIVLIVLLTGCTQNSDNTAKNFTMNFLRNYIRGTGYAILQLDDSVTYQEINGDETIVFENINTSRGTVIVIQDYFRYWNGEHRIDINVNIDVPLREWYLKGYNYPDGSVGEIDVTLDFTGNPEDYEGMLISPSNYGIIFANFIISDFQGDIYHLDEDEDISFFSSIYNPDTDIAFCDWIIGESFVQNEVNEFYLELDKPMLAKTISVNRPITSSKIHAFRNGMLDSNLMHFNSFYDNPVTEFTGFYNDDFPHNMFSIYVNNYNGTEFYRFDNISDEIPSILDIPMSSISAVFDVDNNKFTEILVDGSVDQISASWTQSDSEKFVSLNVYSITNVEEILLPEIPSEILEQLDIDLSLFTLNDISIVDYDTANNSDDIINLEFQQQTPLISLYNQKYNYTRFIDAETLHRERNNRYRDEENRPTLEKW
ncbi:MAG: hypothetical protein P9M11_05060 [Candidatus Tenebribacter burtonii]|nr:hypothetical protein [Candidatus Tenebribacter burtonii]